MKARLLITTLYIFSWFSLPVIHKFAEWLGKMLIYWQPRSRFIQVFQINLAHCFPQLNDAARAELLQRSVIETVKSFAELGALWLWQPQRALNLIKQVDGEKWLIQARREGKKVILLTPHFGAWELTGLYAATHYPLTALYRPPKILDLNNFILNARQRNGGHYVPTDRSGIRELLTALQRNEVVGILPDQVPHDKNQQIFAPFCGVMAETMTLVARLAQKTQAVVIFTYAERLPNGQGFHLHFFPAPEGIDSTDLHVATQALNQGVESCAHRCVEQYQWGYKRFKTRPAGEIAFY